MFTRANVRDHLREYRVRVHVKSVSTGMWRYGVIELST